MPPSAVIRPQTRPRIQGWPRPVRLPSSESASAKPMLMPAPTEAARPTRNASQLLWVAKAAANTGASVETDPSIRPARPGCTICSTNRRRCGLSSSCAGVWAQLVFGQFLGAVFVGALLLRQVVQQLADARRPGARRRRVS